MVEVVEAMTMSGPTHFEAADSTSRLRSTTSGTPSNTIPAPASAAAMPFAGTTETRAMTVLASPSVSNPNRAKLASVLLTSPSASASSVPKASADRGFASILVIGWPAQGHTTAMPRPIRPAPRQAMVGRAVIGQNLRVTGFAARDDRDDRAQGLP